MADIAFLHEVGAGSTATTSPLNVTPSATINIGDFIVVAFTLLSTGTGAAIADDGGNTYVDLGHSSTNAGLYVFGAYATAQVDTLHHITITTTTSTIRAWLVEIFS